MVGACCCCPLQVVFRDPVRYKLQKCLTIAPEGVYSGQVSSSVLAGGVWWLQHHGARRPTSQQPQKQYNLEQLTAHTWVKRRNSRQALEQALISHIAATGGWLPFGPAAHSHTGVVSCCMLRRQSCSGNHAAAIGMDRDLYKLARSSSSSRPSVAAGSPGAAGGLVAAGECSRGDVGEVVCCKSVKAGLSNSSYVRGSLVLVPTWSDGISSFHSRNRQSALKHWARLPGSRLVVLHDKYGGSSCWDPAGSSPPSPWWGHANPSTGVQVLAQGC
jgi:hypothetical protein